MSLVVNDRRESSAASTTTATIVEVNDPPVAAAGQDRSAQTNAAVSFSSSGSYDPDGSITAYLWNFDDGSTSALANPSHAFAAAGVYTVTLTVTDNDGATDDDTAVITVTDQPPAIVAFSDSFEINEWNNLWTEDSQNDWYRSQQRAVDGMRSAEADGPASNAKITSKSINMQGKHNARITFWWYITSNLDTGEYLAFDTSFNNGFTWTERKRLKGNVDTENSWHAVSLELYNITKTSLRIRFKAKMSDASEDADVDNVRVEVW